MIYNGHVFRCGFPIKPDIDDSVIITQQIPVQIVTFFLIDLIGSICTPGCGIYFLVD